MSDSYSVLPKAPLTQEVIKEGRKEVKWRGNSALSLWTHVQIVEKNGHCVPFSSCPQSFSAPGSFPVSRLFVSGGQSTGISASASVLPMNIQEPGLTGLIFLLSKELSRIFSSTTVWKHQFFGTQPSLWFNSYIHTWLLEKTIALTIRTFVSKVVSAFWYTV